MQPGSDDLLVPADNHLGELCDVGGCEEHGRFWYAEWRVCAEHFNMYLQDEFDLEEYFRLKQQKIEEALADEAAEDMFWERYFCVDEDENDQEDDGGRA